MNRYAIFLLIFLTIFLFSCNRDYDFSSTTVISTVSPEDDTPPSFSSEDNMPSTPEEDEILPTTPPEEDEILSPTSPEEDSREDEIPDETAVNEDLPATEAPIINDCLNTEPDLISVSGKCERDAEVTLTSARETVTVKTYGEYFLAQIRIPAEDGRQTLEITACAEGKAPSDAVTKSVRYYEDEYVYDDEWHIRTSNTSRGFARFSFADFEGTNLLTDKQLETFAKRIRAKTQQLDEAVPGCKLIYMIVPNSLTIYDDEAPSELIKATGKTKLDQVIETINSTDAVALDLRPILREHRYDGFEPYLHTDSHWSEYGAYLGLSVLCDYIAEDFPAAQIRPLEEYGFENRLVKGGDVLYYLDMDNETHLEEAPFFNPLFELPVTADKYLDDATLRMDFDATSSRIRISTGNEDLPDCVVFRDSYGIGLYEILPDRFNNTAYYYTWGYNFDISYIKDNAPDYVIYIIAERNMDNIIK